MAGNPVVLHVIGGCHVNGYPFGAEASFIQVALDALGNPDVAVHRQAPVSFRKINAYLDDLTVPIEQGIVVLQIGNHESMKGSWRHSAATSAGEPMEPTSAGKIGLASSRQSFRSLPLVDFTFKQLKLAVFRARELKGDTFFDPAEFNIRITETFAKLAKRRPAKVIVMSSFLADALETNICRKRLNAVLKEATETHGFDYLDAYKGLATAKRAGSARLFCDALHMSEAGQGVVGKLLAGPLGKALQVVA